MLQAARTPHGDRLDIGESLAKLFGDVPFIDPESIKLSVAGEPTSATQLSVRDVDAGFVSQMGDALTFGSLPEIAGTSSDSTAMTPKEPEQPRGGCFRRRLRAAREHGTVDDGVYSGVIAGAAV